MKQKKKNLYPFIINNLEKNKHRDINLQKEMIRN